MSPFLASFRIQLGLIAAVCAGLIGFALYAQYHLHLEPCPLCIFQRIGIIAVGVLALLASLHTPRARWCRGAWAFTVLLACCAGAMVSARHVWLQHIPEGQVPACGPGLSYLMESLPGYLDVIKTVLQGSGECAVVDWVLLGLSMPAWTLLCFVGLGNWALWATFREGATR